jgi:hypothetical protein
LLAILFHILDLSVGLKVSNPEGFLWVVSVLGEFRYNNLIVHHRFLPHPFVFMIHNHLTTRQHIPKFLAWLTGIALDHRLHDRRFESRQGLGIFLFTTASRPALEPIQLLIQWVTGALSLGVKWPGCEVDHLHLVPRSRMRGTIPPLSQYAFRAWCSLKAQGQLYLYIKAPMWRLEAS